MIIYWIIICSLSKNSGFKINDSTINHLLKIVHQIYVDIMMAKTLV